jgi:hypothetical protein
LGLKKLFKFFVNSVLQNRIRDGKIQIRDWDRKILILKGFFRMKQNVQFS